MSVWRRFRARHQLRACDAVGRDVHVDGSLHVQNLGRITLGDDVHLQSTPAMSHLVTGPAGDLRIGRGVRIGHGASIASHETIVIGDDVRIGPYVMLLDTDFHEAGKHDSSGSTGAIRIGAGARLGARVTVLRGSSIGAGAIVAAGSVVKGDVPARAHVSGNPARRGGSRDVPRAGGQAVDIDSVREVVRHTFGLVDAPPSDASRDALRQWDSLGSLNLLLSLEHAFAVNVPSAAMLRVRTIAELVPMLEAAAERAS